jgi:hypothetical protein
MIGGHKYLVSVVLSFLSLVKPNAAPQARLEAGAERTL